MHIIPTLLQEDTSVWKAAVELRNGNQYYISDRVQQAVINNNFYVFQNFNLFYFSRKDGTTSFLGNIPTHEPKHVALVPSTFSEDGVDEGDELLIATDKCLLTLDISNDPQGEKISIEAGHCYESGIRDGPREFARFNSIGAISPGRNQVWAMSDNIFTRGSGARGSRLCLIHNNLVMTFGGGSSIFAPIHTISMAMVERGVSEHGEGEVFIAISWEEGGMHMLWMPQYSLALKELPVETYSILQPPILANKKVLSAQVLPNPKPAAGLGRQLYLFTVDNDGVVARITMTVGGALLVGASDPSSVIILEVLEDTSSIISLYVDFPFGVFLADSVRRVFARVNTVGGCACRPGYALIGEGTRCQVAPSGGYVDLWGNFIPCLPGTFEARARATSHMACLPCPPFKIAPNAQSMSCSPCFFLRAGESAPLLLPHNLNRTQCLAADEECPAGTYLAMGGCKACPAGSSSAEAKCQACPRNTYSDPSKGILTCTACPEGKVAPVSSSVSCATLCPSSGCAPQGNGVCVPAIERKIDLVISIAVLGIKAIGADAASNGTVYIAGFQMLIVVDQSGSSINIPLNEFTLVRDIKLSSDEQLLFAAVSSHEILSFRWVGSPRMSFARTPAIAGASIIGIVPRVGGAMLVHDAGSNQILLGTTKGSGSLAEWKTVYNGGRDASVILNMLLVEESQTLFIMLQSQIVAMLDNNSTISQSIVVMSLTSSPGTPPMQTVKPKAMILNPYMSFWRGELLVSAQNAIARLNLANGELMPLVGAMNISGRVDHSGEAARFLSPGPMITARLHPQVLLAVDETALRAVHALGESCLCDKDHFLFVSTDQQVACVPCPPGTFAAAGAVGACSTCQRGQYFDNPSGKCVPCPKIRWWRTEDIPSCPLVLDTMVERDAAGLTMTEIVWEMSKENPQHSESLSLMTSFDYVSMHSLQIPLQTDSAMQDDAGRGRFWVRVKRITPPPLIFLSTSPNTPLDVRMDVVLPGFWIVCSAYVLQTETCSCDLPAGGIKLGNSDDNSELWNRERNRAAAIDYSSLLITLPPDPDLYDGGGIEYIHFMNISVAPTALFVSRSDAGGGTDDDNPSVIFVDSVLSATQVPIPPSPEPTPSESSFAACIAGWPATYSCPPGFLWVPPLYTCVPCKPGFYHDVDQTGHCLPCPVGSFSAVEGSTACTECAVARAVASSECLSWLVGNANHSFQNTTVTIQACSLGYEERLDVDTDGSLRCLPCIPGFFRAELTLRMCSPCPAGTFAATAAQTVCTRCASPLVSTQWGSTECIACAAGYVPTHSLDRCKVCIPDVEYFVLDAKTKIAGCRNKTVMQCPRGYYLGDGGSIADNQCVRCVGCSAGEVMTPYDPRPCQSYDFTRFLGAPYRCVPIDSFPGLFARLALSRNNIHNFSIQYTPCEGLPAYASWVRGPDPTLCFFSCNYAVSEAGARQYSYYFGNEHVQFSTTSTTSMILALPATENLFILDYPGLSLHLTLLSNEICLPCPKTQCGWGKYRPITDLINGCGPPTCVLQGSIRATCQVVPGGTVVTQYANDGCIADCTIPANAYLSDLSPPGTGDNCGWKCMLGFFKDVIMVDRDENETGYICSPCGTSLCNSGQEFIPLQCMPSKSFRDFCVPCPPQRGLAVLSPDSPRGVCKYECPPGTYSSKSVVVVGAPPVCIACHNMTYCPAGFRRVCAAEQCLPCSKLPLALWGSAVTMPSNKDSCQVACKTGYHTVELGSGKVIEGNALAKSYDSLSISCTLCALRPAIPCSSFNMCPTGYFLPVPGSAFCKPCPTLYECAAGYFPSSCICTICSTPLLSDTIFVHPRAVDALAPTIGAIVMYSGSCPYVCKHNTVLWRGVCTPCSSFVQAQSPVFTAYYSVWNASDGVRWWGREQDPPHLPPRSSSSPNAAERRAGLCWPCPPETLTAENDLDICQTPARPAQGEATFFEQALHILSGPEGSLSLSSLSDARNGLPNYLMSFLTGEKHRRRLLTSESRKKMQFRGGYHQVFAQKKAKKWREKKGTVLRGIPIHPKSHQLKGPGHSKTAPSLQHTTFSDLRTCPPFAEWHSISKAECVCRQGFVRHMEHDACVLAKHRDTQRTAFSSASSVRVIEVKHHTKEKKQCEERECPPGKYKDAHGSCRICPLMHGYNASSGRCECIQSFCLSPSSSSFHDPSKGLSQCPGNAAPLQALEHDSELACGCPKGYQWAHLGGTCEPCPKGTYSAFLGHSPCVACPLGKTTEDIASDKAIQCLEMNLAKDDPFVHPQAKEFYSSPLQMHHRLRKNEWK